MDKSFPGSGVRDFSLYFLTILVRLCCATLTPLRPADPFPENERGNLTVLR